MTRQQEEAIHLAYLERNSRHTVTANGDGTYTHTFSPVETAYIGMQDDAGKHREKASK